MFYLLNHHLMLLLCTVFFILHFVKYKNVVIKYLKIIFCISKYVQELLSEIITAQGNNIKFLFNKNSGTKVCKNPVQLCKLNKLRFCGLSLAIQVIIALLTLIKDDLFKHNITKSLLITYSYAQHSCAFHDYLSC